MKKCSKCNILKELTEFGIRKKSSDGKKSACKLCLRLDNQLYYKDNKEKESLRKKKSYQLNREKIISKTSKYNINRRKTDILFRIKHNIRKRIRNIILSKRFNKNNNFSKYIGCTLDELKHHIERQFKEGMTWDNYGKWEIDHILPLSKANNIEEIYKLNHYTNLQPLWLSENRFKSNR